jgi:hypothetical protein
LDARRLNSVRRVVACALLVAAVTVPLQAQVAKGRGVIDGLVTDTSFVPLEGATAELIASGMDVRTAANGRFRMLALPTGQYLLTVRRLGYSPLSTLVSVAASDTVRASFMLRPTPLSLDRVRINAASEAPSLTEFEQRRARGVGQFMTESEIHKLNFVGTSDLLRTFQSVAVGTTVVVNTRGFGFHGCPYRVFVDGVPIAPLLGLDADLPPPGQIAGIEVHTNSATVPLQYATFGGAAGSSAGGGVCGVILIWTKH